MNYKYVEIDSEDGIKLILSLGLEWRWVRLGQPFAVIQYLR